MLTQTPHKRWRVARHNPRRTVGRSRGRRGCTAMWGPGESFGAQPARASRPVSWKLRTARARCGRGPVVRPARHEIRVLVCDELPIMRDGVRTLLEAEPDIEVVDTTDSGIHAMILIRTLEPAVVLLGMTLRSLPALEVVRRVAAEPLPTQPRFVVLGAPDDSIDDVLRAQVNGVLLRDVTREELSAAVRTAARGHMALCPQVAQSLVDFFRASRHRIERAAWRAGPRPPPT